MAFLPSLLSFALVIDYGDRDTERGPGPGLVFLFLFTRLSFPSAFHWVL